MTLEGNAQPAHDAGESSSRRLSYVPYQRKAHSRNVSHASFASAGSDVSERSEALSGLPSDAANLSADRRSFTPTTSSPSSSAVGPSQPFRQLDSRRDQHTPTRTHSVLSRSGTIPSSPAPIGVGLVRSHRDLDTPPPPLRVASKLKNVDTQENVTSPSSKVTERPTPLRLPSGGSTSIVERASDTTRSTQVARTNGAKPEKDNRIRSTDSAQPRISQDRAHPRPGTLGADTSRSSSVATSPHNSGSSTPVKGMSIPAHVNSYAALLAAQSKLGPIPVPQGVAFANAAGISSAKPASDGRTTAYRSGFQPKGVLRVRTDDFNELRRHRRSQGEMEEQRMDRRLEKLLTIHFAPVSDSESSREAKKPTTSSFVDFDLEELKRDPSGMLKKSGTDLWASFRARGRGEDPAIRAAEQTIVMWQNDAEAKTCPICDTPFSLSVRKHHCRLCGRVVCASPHLARLHWTEQMNGNLDQVTLAQQRLSFENRCSSNIIADPISGKIEDVKEGPSVQNNSNSGVVPHKGVRICRDCKSTVRKRQYMLDDKPFPVFIKLYEALMRVQREIEQSLPEFQEMVLGLQKQDQNAALGSSIKANVELQRDAVQARKQLLSNFATYDELAKRIRKLPSDIGHGIEGDVGDAAQERIQHAIFTRANLFLQQNMLPLQSLPKLGSKNTTADDASDSSVSVTTSPRASSPQLSTRRSTNMDTTSSVGSFRSLFGGSRRGSIQHAASVKVDESEEEDTMQDNASPAELREQLKVLLEQENLVAEYVESAAKSRKFDDARTLKKSHEELCKEILRIQRKLAVNGQGR